MRSFSCAAALVALGLLASCGQREPTANDDVTLQLSWRVSPEHAPLILGATEIFPQYGINLELVASNGSNETLTSVAAGTHPFVIASAESLVLARDQGVPVRSVMQMYRTSPAVVFNIDGAPLNAPSDLVGLRVGVIPTSTVTTQLNLMLAQNNVRHAERAAPGTVQYIAAVAGGAAQLEADQIDALTHYWNYAPAQYAARDRTVSVLKLSEHGVNTYSAGLVVADDTINEKEDLVQRFVCAIVESYERAIANPEEAIAAYAATQEALTDEDRAYARLSLERTNELLQQDGRPVGYHDVDGWRATLETMSAASLDAEGARTVRLSDPGYLFDRRFYDTVEQDGCEGLRRS